MENEILSANEVAALLKLHPRTVYKLATEGKLPGKMIGRSWRFRRSELMNLLSAKETVEKDEC